MKRTLLSFILCLFTGIAAQAVEHTITFGVGGNIYTPSSLTVAVGDIITWSGNFGSHPLASTSVPSGAATFSNNSGSTFSYTVEVPGDYTYRCTNHFGMEGGFTATTVQIQPIAASVPEVNVYPTLTSGMVNVDFTGFSAADNFNVDVFTVTGQKVFAATSKGTNLSVLDVSSLRNGIYLVAVSKENATLAIRRIVKN